MSRDFRLFVSDILEAIARIREYLADMDKRAFAQDRRTQDAVIRNLEVIGEAARQIPDQIRQQAPSVEWRKICGLRDILIHQSIWDQSEYRLGHCNQRTERARSTDSNDFRVEAGYFVTHSWLVAKRDRSTGLISSTSPCRNYHRSPVCFVLVDKAPRASSLRRGQQATEPHLATPSIWTSPNGTIVNLQSGSVTGFRSSAGGFQRNSL